MELEINNFYLKDMQFGDETSFKNGVLTVNKEEAIKHLMDRDSNITKLDLLMVSPGDDVRLCPVKDAFEARFRLDGNPLFPGADGKLVNAGEGKINAIKDMSILVVGETWGGFQDGIIDMGGVGAKYTYYSQMKNLVLIGETNEIFEQKEQQKKNHALRWAGIRLSEYIGKTTEGQKADEIEKFHLDPISKRTDDINKLPSVVLVLQAQSQMEEMGYNTLNYGWDTNHMLPTFMHPNEILGNAMLSGSFMPCSSKWSTYDYQNFPMLKKLYSEHGKTINFLGVIMSNLNVALEQKERSGIFVAQMAKSLGADSAVLAEEGYGNPDADFIECFVALEDAGVKTVGLTNECTGRDGGSQPLVALDVKADAIVSCGNVSTLLELPAVKTVIGNLDSIARDGYAGGWEDDEKLGPSVRKDGSIIIENNSMFCGDQVVGWSNKTMVEY